MGLIQRIASFAGFEKRDVTACIDPSWDALKYGFYAPNGLSPLAAENLAAVTSAVNAIARALASLTVYIYRRDETGKKIEQPDHPLALMYRYGVTPQQIWMDWMEHSVASILLQGNSLSIILRDGRGTLAGLKYVPWSWVTVALLPNGRLAYDISDPFTGKAQRYIQDEVLHLKDRTDDGGRIGKSVLARAAESVRTVQGTNNLAAAMLRNGAYPSGFLSAPGLINPETAERLKSTWRASIESGKAGTLAVAGDGLKWEALSLSPESVELLESRKFGVTEMVRLFNIPPIFVGDYSSSTFTNATTMVQIFASFALGQWACKIQQAFAQSILSREYELRLDLSDFQRGDPTQRWASYDIASRNKILTPNEIREAENYNPRVGGDEFSVIQPPAKGQEPGPVDNSAA